MSNTQFQDALSTRMPPSGGPSAGPMIAPIAKMPWLTPSCLGGNVSRRMAWPVASSPPPNAPCTTRQTIN